MMEGVAPLKRTLRSRKVANVAVVKNEEGVGDAGGRVPKSSAETYDGHRRCR